MPKDTNDEKIAKLSRTYRLAATALLVEILSLAVLLGDNISRHGRCTKAPDWNKRYSAPRATGDSRRIEQEQVALRD